MAPLQGQEQYVLSQVFPRITTVLSLTLVLGSLALFLTKRDPESLHEMGLNTSTMSRLCTCIHITMGAIDE